MNYVMPNKSVRSVKPPILFRVWLSTPDMGKNIGYHIMPESRIMEEINPMFVEHWNMMASVIKDKIYTALEETFEMSETEMIEFLEASIMRSQARKEQTALIESEIEQQ